MTTFWKKLKQNLANKLKIIIILHLSVIMNKGAYSNMITYFKV